MKSTDYSLYWEDAQVRFVHAGLDDRAWRLAEKIFGYKKKNTIYIFHDKRLAAYYHVDDSRVEAAAGYDFYRSRKHADRIITLKKAVAEKVRSAQKRFAECSLEPLNDKMMLEYLVSSLDLWREAVSVHYLTQPQFFEKFEELHDTKHMDILGMLADARFTYTRFAWTAMHEICQFLLGEYARRRSLSLDEAEACSYEEIVADSFDPNELRKRANEFVLTAAYHVLTVYTEKEADEFIATYENYPKLESVKGIIGNGGIVSGEAFVLKNEHLDLKNLPKGMRHGMTLIVQNAWPELSAYYASAGAIVTNEGGITSHGVVVARELGIPCIVGTRIATKIFSTGDMVEVDADAGIVRKL